VGTFFWKKFDDGWFWGIIAGIGLHQEDKTPYYFILYEDNDWEEVFPAELRKICKNAKTSKPCPKTAMKLAQLLSTGDLSSTGNAALTPTTTRMALAKHTQNPHSKQKRDANKPHDKQRLAKKWPLPKFRDMLHSHLGDRLVAKPRPTDLRKGATFQILRDCFLLSWMSPLSSSVGPELTRAESSSSKSDSPAMGCCHVHFVWTESYLKLHPEYVFVDSKGPVPGKLRVLQHQTCTYV
jgi:hypothetical protein